MCYVSFNNSYPWTVLKCLSLRTFYLCFEHKILIEFKIDNHDKIMYYKVIKSEMSARPVACWKKWEKWSSDWQVWLKNKLCIDFFRIKSVTKRFCMCGVNFGNWHWMNYTGIWTKTNASISHTLSTFDQPYWLVILSLAY